jgi:hypothetical protein
MLRTSFCLLHSQPPRPPESVTPPRVATACLRPSLRRCCACVRVRRRRVRRRRRGRIPRSGSCIMINVVRRTLVVESEVPSCKSALRQSSCRFTSSCVSICTFVLVHLAEASGEGPCSQLLALLALSGCLSRPVVPKSRTPWIQD